MIHESFKARMRDMLGEEYPAFISALESAPTRGARVNLIKCPSGKLPDEAGLSVRKIPYADNGYILESELQIGRTAVHHAGIIYMQDPGAMAAMSAIDIPEGACVADLCAAPGGKSGQIAERLGEGGFLLSNEYVPKRAKTIVGNLERLGAKRSIVTSMDTAALTKLYRSFFDIVVVDAPCSGEGMFRKSEEARAEWTPDSPAACAERQREILANAVKLLKPGGTLLYSTCTWSLEENEMIVLWLLDSYPELSLTEVKDELKAATSDGIVLCGREELRLTRRCYPHVTDGEGQFVAVLKKADDEGDLPTILYKDSTKAPTKEEKAAFDAFVRDAKIKLPEGRLVKAKENLVFLAHSYPLPPHSLFMSGILCGEVRRGILHPSHQLFSALGENFARKLELGAVGERVEKYLAGEEIDAPEMENGWCVVTVAGAPLGGGKVSSGRLKNHYPKGLRNTR